jgi:hypothetical protein
MHSAVSHPNAHIATAPPAQLQGWIRLAGVRLKSWIEAYFDAAAEAAIYRELSALSDAELARRGIPRGELHRCVFGTGGAAE